MTETVKPTELETGSVPMRVLALLIDTAVIFALAMVPYFIGLSDNWRLFIALLAALASIGYRLFGDAVFGGAGLGKRLTGLRVVDAETRHPVSLMQCAIRNGILLIPLAPVVEVILLGIDGQQRWGDQVARTYVLRTHVKVAPYHAPDHPIDFAGLKDTVIHLHPQSHSDAERK